MNSSELGKKSFSNTFYALIDTLSIKVSSTVAFILLVRLLNEEAIAAVGISFGYIVFLSYFNLGAIRILYRDFPQYSSDKDKSNEILSAIFSSFILQTLVMLIVCSVITLLIFPKLKIDGLTFLFWGQAIEFVSYVYQEWIKVIFFVNFRQSLSTKISIAANVFRLLAFCLLLFRPSLDNYVWILIITSFLNIFLWSILFLYSYHFRLSLNFKTPKLIIDCLKDYGLWNHFNRMVIDTIYNIDTVILSFLGYYKEIAAYTIALKFISLFFIIPAQLGRSLQVLLSNYTDKERKDRAINTFFKINAAISFFQILFVMFAGKFLLFILFGKNSGPDVLHFSMIIIFGVTLLNLSIPFISILNNYLKLQKLFLTIFLPTFIVSVVVYFTMAYYWGAIGLAYGKVIVYTILFFLLATCTAYNYKLKFHIKLLTVEEKLFLKRYIKH